MKKYMIALPMLLMLISTAFGITVTLHSDIYHSPYPTTYPSVLEPGDENILVEIQMKNEWTQTFYRVSTTLEETGPFEVIDGTDYLERINPKQWASVFYKINVKENAFPGEYRVVHKLVYYDYNETKIEASRTLRFRILTSHRLEFEKIEVIPEEVLAGQTATVEVDLKNTGNVVLDDIDVTFSGLTSDTLLNLEPVSPMNYRIRRINPQETGTATFKLRASNLATPGVYGATVTASYEGHNGTASVSDMFNLGIAGEPSLDLIEQKFTHAPIPGKTVTLTLTLENRGGSNLYGIKATLKPINSEVAVMSDSSLHIDKFEAGTTQELLYDIRLDRDAPPGSYTAKLGLSSTAFTDNQNVSFEVIGIPDLRSAGVQTDEETIYSGDPFSLSVQLENIGTGDAKSVVAVFEDSDVRGVLTSYVGTVEADDTGTAIFDITDNAAGDKEVDVILTYEDEYGNVYTKTLKANYVIKGKSVDIFTPLILLIIIGAIGYYLYRRQQKSKEIQKLVK
jgi:hypothetical protein